MNQEDKYWLIEFIVELEKGKVPQVINEYTTFQAALNRFNHDIEGNFLGAPYLGPFPEAYIIKGRKIEIEVKKIGSVKENDPK